MKKIFFLKSVFFPLLHLSEKTFKTRVFSSLFEKGLTKFFKNKDFRNKEKYIYIHSPIWKCMITRKNLQRKGKVMHGIYFLSLRFPNAAWCKITSFFFFFELKKILSKHSLLFHLRFVRLAFFFFILLKKYCRKIFIYLKFLKAKEGQKKVLKRNI